MLTGMLCAVKMSCSALRFASFGHRGTNAIRHGFNKLRPVAKIRQLLDHHVLHAGCLLRARNVFSILAAT